MVKSAMGDTTTRVLMALCLGQLIHPLATSLTSPPSGEYTMSVALAVNGMLHGAQPIHQLQWFEEGFVYQSVVVGSIGFLVAVLALPRQLHVAMPGAIALLSPAVPYTARIPLSVSGREFWVTVLYGIGLCGGAVFVLLHLIRRKARDLADHVLLILGASALWGLNVSYLHQTAYFFDGLAPIGITVASLLLFIRWLQVSRLYRWAGPQGA